MFTTETIRLKRIQLFLMQEEVRFNDIVALLCQIKGISLKDVAMNAGLSREHLYMITSGKRPVNDAVRAAFKDLLGLDPWGKD